MCFGLTRNSPKHRKCEKEVKGALPAVAAISAVSAIPTASATTAASATIPAASAAISPATAATATAATRAFCLRARFVDNKVPAAKVLTVQTGDRAICFFIIGDLDEGETA